jgi:hypothetical protein
MAEKSAVNDVTVNDTAVDGGEVVLPLLAGVFDELPHAASATAAIAITAVAVRVRVIRIVFPLAFSRVGAEGCAGFVPR